MGCKSRRKVVFDIDGCLANFEDVFAEEFGNRHRNLYRLEERYPEQVDRIKRFVENPYTYLNLEVLPLGKKLYEYFYVRDFKLIASTARPENTILTTNSWLLGNGFIFNKLSIGKVRKKLTLLQERPDFVVDDLLDIVEYAADELEIPSFLIDQEWNQKKKLSGNIHRIKTYEDFISIMEKLY